MRRLHRCLFICHRALAPLLFLTIAGLWLASYHFAFDIFRCNPFVRISIGQGTIDISRNNRPVNQNVFSEEFLSKWHIARSNGFASLVDNFARSSLEFAGAAEATQSMLGFSHTYSKGPNNQ